MGKIIVIGSTNTDMVVSSSKIPKPGETVLGSEFAVIAGGKGANQAVAASRAGGEVAFVAKVGNDDFGRRTRLAFVENNMSTKNLIIDHEKPSGVAMIIVDEKTGQNSIVVASGANGTLSCEDVKNAEKEIKSASVMLVQLESPIESIKYALELAKKHGLTCILNPAPAQELSDDLLALVDIITPNETETEILTGTLPTNENSTKLGAEKLLGKVGKTVIITLGSKGVFYLSKDGSSGFIEADTVQAVDTTAAGDVFNGYLATMIAGGLLLKDAIRLACKAATISVTKKGAQPSIPHISDII